MSKFKLACEENYFIYSKIENERKKYLRLKEDQKSNNAKRILSALEKFPLPLVSGKVALALLQGVGPQWSSEIDLLLKDKPCKRKASPEPVQKRYILVPIFGSPEWIILMCLFLADSPAASYDIPYLMHKWLENYSFPPLTNISSILEHLESLDLLSEDSGLYSLTENGFQLSSKLQSDCPTVTKINTQNFDPDSWLVEEYEDNISENEPDQINFELVLLVDTAERLSMDFEIILNRLSRRNLVVEKRKLWIGDYQWICRLYVDGKIIERTLKYVVERKTADDLAHSIVDFRYEEQKIRMKMSGAICIYLLEGKNPQKSYKINGSTLLNSLISTKFNYGFQIKITQDSKDTLNWLTRFTSAIFEEISTWSSEKFLNLPTYEAFYDETNPFSGITVKEVFGKQLRSLDKVGEYNTLAILKSYSTPLLFYNAIKNAAKTGKRALNRFLKSIKLENGNILHKSTREVLVNLFLG